MPISAIPQWMIVSTYAGFARFEFRKFSSAAGNPALGPTVVGRVVLGGLRPLSVAAYEAIGQASQLLLSVVSFAEIWVKASVGKLSAPPDFYNRVLDAGRQVLPVDAAHGLAVAELPLHHRDPFDRLLIAQA